MSEPIAPIHPLASKQSFFDQQEKRTKYRERQGVPVPLKIPDQKEMAKWLALLKPWEKLTRPSFLGMENLLGKGPAILVGNHTLMGILDASLMWSHLFRKKGIYLRAMGDHFHFKVPLWRDLMFKFGMVDGTRKNCSTLLDRHNYILVFPGGAREAFKNKGEQYQLIWKKRTGFAKMAIKHGCPIIPFAAVGAEECYQILVDNRQIMATPLGKLMKKIHLKGDHLPPLVRGIGPTILPRPKKMHFLFGKPIETTIYQGEHQNIVYCKELHHIVRHQVALQIEELQDERNRHRVGHLIK